MLGFVSFVAVNSLPGSRCHETGVEPSGCRKTGESGVIAAMQIEERQVGDVMILDLAGKLTIGKATSS